MANAWRFPDDSRIIKIFEIAFTPEEGRVLLELNTPVTRAELVEKLGEREEYVQEKLDSLGGWARPVEGKSISIPNMIGVIPERSLPDIPREKVVEVWSDFWRSGEHPKWLLETWVRMYNISGQPIHRILP